MTIEIPDDLAHDLEGLASAQRKTLQELALEKLRAVADDSQSPQALLAILKSLPHPSLAALDEFDSAIADGRMTVKEKGPFDR